MLVMIITPYLVTSLIHDFTAMTFSVKLAHFREIPWNPWFQRF